MNITMKPSMILLGSSTIAPSHLLPPNALHNRTLAEGRKCGCQLVKTRIFGKVATMRTVTWVKMVAAYVTVAGSVCERNDICADMR